MIRFLQRQKAKKGFTVIELIVVIAIIGILIAVIVPSLSQERSRINEAGSAARDFYAAVQTVMSYFSTFDGQMSNEYSKDNNLGIMRYYPKLNGNYPFDKDHADTEDPQFPENVSLYIMVHAENDNIKDIAVVSRSRNYNKKEENGLYRLLQRNSADRNTEFGRILAGELDNRVQFNDGWFYARVDFTYIFNSLTSEPINIGLQTLKVAYTAYCRKELPQAPDSYDSSFTNQLVFTKDNKLAWNNGQICGTCAAKNASSTLGLAGTKFEQDYLI